MASTDNPLAAAANQPAPGSDVFEIIRQSLASIRFGAIQLTVHDGKLVQVDVTEKRRLQP